MADHRPADRVALVGHDPDLSDALADLSGAASIGLRKGAMACLEFMGEPAAGSGRLRWLLDPDLYRDDPQHGLTPTSQPDRRTARSPASAPTRCASTTAGSC